MKRILALFLIVSVVGAVVALARPAAQSYLPLAPVGVRPQYSARPIISLVPAPVPNRVVGPFAPSIGRVPNVFSLPYQSVCGPTLCVSIPTLFAFGLPIQGIGE